MNENDRYPSGAQGGTTPSSMDRRTEELSSREKPSVTQAVSEASETVVTETKALGKEAQQVAEEQAEKVKEATASHMDKFADALRAASEELSKNQSGPAAEMVANAAAGLEGLSRSIHGKTTGEMIETVRRFGRENPMGFLAGSVLAGLALGRFAAAASPSHSSPSGPSAPPGSSAADSETPGAGVGGYKR